MYRPSWWPNDTPDIGGDQMGCVVSMCQILHMDHIGAYQDLKPKDRDQMIRAIGWLINNWKDSRKETLNYDNAILNLMSATLEERSS